jgi:hypothetical protein
MIVGCPGGNMMMDSNPLAQMLALITTAILLLMVIGLYMALRDDKNILLWSFLCVITIIVVTVLNIISFTGW